MLCHQPLDPQPEDVHPDGKPGRRVPSLESQSEYVTGEAVGLKQECPELYVTWHKNCNVVERQGNFPFLAISSLLHLYGNSNEGTYVRKCITVRIMLKRIRG